MTPPPLPASPGDSTVLALLIASGIACYVACKAITWIRARSLPSPRAFRRALNKCDDPVALAKQHNWKRGPRS